MRFTRHHLDPAGRSERPVASRSTRRRALRPLVALAVVIVGAAACGSDPGSNSGAAASGETGASTTTTGKAPTSSDVDACGLVTDDQAAAALDEEVRPGEASTAGPATSCLWSSASGPAGTGVTLTVLPAAVITTTLEVGNANGYLIEPVDGLGESAFYQVPETSPSDAALSFVAGDNGYTVFVNDNSMSADQIRAAELELAQQVAANR